MSVQIEVDLTACKQLAEVMNQLAEHPLSHDALDTIGSQLESGARRRIQTEKESPEGDAWEPWAESYAKTRGDEHSLLVSGGFMQDLLDHFVDDDSAVAGSNQVQAAIHQFGGETGRGHKTIITARPYLGISETDERYIADAIMADLEGAFDA
ncbi:phage virion morphogenesis protein [Desulfovibrio sp. JC010]|uniref:phage virion morphogenesis protein n=1 Tax=Desulfovibrio sp. JC010 TaxID=2593641 RepID=UPI0013D50083|nr:phage virion morphogenesis protein [Desulfovibrio sp. JC010]NDV27720.1 phage virion morphogenesis protein [Desulfovibrio sp. JC010]